MNSKNIWKYGFNTGSLIGGAYFLYNIASVLFAFEANVIWRFLGSFIIIFGFGWALTNYRKNVYKEKLTFSKAFSLGAVISLIMTLIYAIFQILLVVQLNPNFLDDYVVLSQQTLEQMNYDTALIYDETMVSALKTMYMPFELIRDYIGNLFCLLLVILVLSQMLFSSSQNDNEKPNDNNDYVPYKDVTKENEETENQNEDLTDQNKDLKN
ncbi:MAG: DUF4199 domain-containing protein [Bacteroidales bacterium]|jgi:hypothetical protein|nr:DUF4199 domain-containing protein [Bacteroidales bacterium]